MNYYNEIKEQLTNNEIIKKVKDYSKNRSDLNTYYNVGKLLSKAGKRYGEGIIKEYSRRLTNELGKGYGLSSLKNVRRFYILFSKSQAVPDQLTWSHYIELLKFDNMECIYYYIDNNLKRHYQDKSIGIIICKRDNKFIMEYCSDKRIISKEYQLIWYYIL